MEPDRPTQALVATVRAIEHPGNSAPNRLTAGRSTNRAGRSRPQEPGLNRQKTSATMRTWSSPTGWISAIVPTVPNRNPIRSGLVVTGPGPIAADPTKTVPTGANAARAAPGHAAGNPWARAVPEFRETTSPVSRKEPYWASRASLANPFPNAGADQAAACLRGAGARKADFEPRSPRSSTRT